MISPYPQYFSFDEIQKATNEISERIRRNREGVKNKSSPDEEVVTFKKKLKEAINSNPIVEKFLKKEHVYGRFISAVSKQRAKRGPYEQELTFRRIRSSDCNGFINEAICWRETTEGHEFWRNLNHKFMEEQTKLPF